MSQPRQFGMMGGGHQQINDTTFTKLFVGGLAWETQRDTMRRYFEQFGEILEAVVITDKNTGRSKGYGFVTFKDPDAAVRACQNPSPVIDGRRANCNLASLGANKPRQSAPEHGLGRFRPASGLITPPPYQASSSAFFNQPTGQYAFPYSAYGYTGYSQESMYPMGYYNVYGGQQFSPYYLTGASSQQAGIYQNLYPFYPQYAQRAHAHGLGLQYPAVAQYPYLPQHFNSSGILSLPSSVTVAAPSTGMVTTTATVAATGTSPAQASGTASEQNPAT